MRCKSQVHLWSVEVNFTMLWELCLKLLQPLKVAVLKIKHAWGSPGGPLAYAYSQGNSWALQQGCSYAALIWVLGTCSQQMPQEPCTVGPQAVENLPKDGVGKGRHCLNHSYLRGLRRGLRQRVRTGVSNPILWKKQTKRSYLQFPVVNPLPITWVSRSASHREGTGWVVDWGVAWALGNPASPLVQRALKKP